MRFVYGLLAFLALLVLAVFVVPLLLDWERFKPEITERMEAVAGRELWIDGEIAVSILPSPKVTITDLRLANLPGATVPDIARVESIDLALALGPLFSGEFAITGLEMVEPVIELERLADGRPNWTFGSPPGGASEEIAGRESGTTDSQPIRIDSITIRNGTVVYRDAGGRPPARIERIEANFSARSLDGPFRGEGAFSIRESMVGFRFATGVIGENRDLPATIEAVFDGGRGTVLIEGTVQNIDDSPSFDGAMRATAPDLGALLSAFVADLEAVPSAALLSDSLSAKGTIRASAEALAVRELLLRLGESQATGALSWRGGDEPFFDARIALNRIDLDEIMPAGAALAPSSAEGQADLGEEATGKPGIAASLETIPEDMAATVDLTVGTVTYRGGVIRQAQAILALDEGVVTIQQASALLPGGADVTLFGQVTVGGDGPWFDGTADIAADDLRAVLAWLGLDLDPVPADRLRRLAANLDLSAQGDRIAASKMDIRVDAARIAGNAAVEIGDRLRVSGALAVDGINADAYLPTGTGGGNMPVSDADGGWPVPDGIDADLKLAIGALTYGGVRLLGLELDALLENGDVTVRRASAMDAAGARVSLNGTARRRGTGATVDLALEGTARSLSGLVALLDIDPAFRSETVGAITLQGVLTGDEEALAVDLALAARAAELSLTGTITTPLDEPSANLALRLRASDAAELARIAGLTPTAAIERLGALALDGGIEGNAASVAVTLGADIAGATLRIGGKMRDPFVSPSYRVSVDFRHPRASVFIETMTGDSAAKSWSGGLHLAGTVSGDRAAADISDLAVEIAGNRIGGGVFLHLDRAPLSVSADLRADDLDLALLSGITESGEAGGMAATGGSGRADSIDEGAASRSGQWSDEPIDLAFLDHVDGTLTLDARALILESYRIEQAVLDLTAAEGALTLRSLRGRIFGGALKAEGGLAGGSEPTGSVRFHLSDLDIGAALRHAAGVNAVTGRATIDGRLTTSGATERAMIRGLAGDATIGSRGGAVEGVNLPAINRRLGGLDGSASFVALAEAGLSSGRTAIRSLDGTIRVRDGLARIDDVTVVADSGSGAIHGTADLAAWSIDLVALFRLMEHPEAPPIGVKLVGSIDRPERRYLIEEMQAYLVEHGFPAAARQRDPSGTMVREGAGAEPGTAAATPRENLPGDRNEGGDRAELLRTEQPVPRPAPVPERDRLQEFVDDLLRKLGD